MSDKKQKVKMDSRRVDYVKEFLPGGNLYGFKKLVEENAELELLFRGNSGENGNTTIIYYNNHIVFKIEKHRYEFLVTLSFSHARYSEDWENKQRDLENLGFRKSKDNKCMYCEKEKYEDSFINDAYAIIKQYMVDYFNPNKKVDQFKKVNNEKQRKKDDKIEKIRQQELMRILNDSKNGYFVYDLEFAQKHANKNESKQDTEKNQPDMLAIKFKDENPEKIVLIEVKSTTKACKYESGVMEHLKKMKKYSEDYIKMDVRKKDACGIISDYVELQLRNLNKERHFDEDQFLGLDTEILLIFTDGAVDHAIKYYEEARKDEADLKIDVLFSTFENGHLDLLK